VRENAVWIAPTATRYSCLCERCLEEPEAVSFLDAVRLATVRGSLPLETEAAAVRCPAGHELIVRRVDRPPKLALRNARQLQLA
jgi:hypothetical protein